MGLPGLRLDRVRREQLERGREAVAPVLGDLFAAPVLDGPDRLHPFLHPFLLHCQVRLPVLPLPPLDQGRHRSLRLGLAADQGSAQEERVGACTSQGVVSVERVLFSERRQQAGSSEAAPDGWGGLAWARAREARDRRAARTTGLWNDIEFKNFT